MPPEVALGLRVRQYAYVGKKTEKCLEMAAA